MQAKTVCGIVKDHAPNRLRVEQIVKKWMPSKEQLERVKALDAQTSTDLSADLDKWCKEMQQQVKN
jgi:hypothetical protein